MKIKHEICGGKAIERWFSVFACFAVLLRTDRQTKCPFYFWGVVAEVVALHPLGLACILNG